ncbi:MAG: transcription termination factor Rho [Chloroflexi bacterium]|nr:transcription termination factor Rho [Chloroflexota bacterium]
MTQQTESSDPARRSRRRNGGGRGGATSSDSRGPQIHVQTADAYAMSGILVIENDTRGGHLLTEQFAATGVRVPAALIKRDGLRPGDWLEGGAAPDRDPSRPDTLFAVDTVNDLPVEEARRRPHFEALTPVHPNELLKLEADQKNLSQRLVDITSPIGKGQRVLLVSPPKAGKTMLMKAIAQGITANHPEIRLIVALVGERPEEVPDMRRSVAGEVYASTFDEPIESHTFVAEMTLEIAKRAAEAGQDVVVMMDSITRLARAYNIAIPTSGRTMSGGMDPAALYPPKRFFGAARKLEEGGSLTIIATCLVDTGSRMDDVIYEEYKGTGNSELILDRKLAERRIFPAIDVQRSGTRREELLLDEQTLKLVWQMRRMLAAVDSDGGSSKAIELLLNRLAKTENNSEFLISMSGQKTAAPATTVTSI